MLLLYYYIALMSAAPGLLCSQLEWNGGTANNKYVQLLLLQYNDIISVAHFSWLWLCNCATHKHLTERSLLYLIFGSLSRVFREAFQSCFCHNSNGHWNGCLSQEIPKASKSTACGGIMAAVCSFQCQSVRSWLRFCTIFRANKRLTAVLRCLPFAQASDLSWMSNHRILPKAA